MGELLDAVQARFQKDKSVAEEQELRVRLKMTTLAVCRQHLIDTDDTLRFEVEKSLLPYIDVLFEDSDIQSNYHITQIEDSPSEFFAQGRGIEF